MQAHNNEPGGNSVNDPICEECQRRPVHSAPTTKHPRGVCRECYELPDPNEIAPLGFSDALNLVGTAIDSGSFGHCAKEGDATQELRRQIRQIPGDHLLRKLIMVKHVVLDSESRVDAFLEVGASIALEVKLLPGISRKTRRLRCRGPRGSGACGGA